MDVNARCQTLSWWDTRMRCVVLLTSAYLLLTFVPLSAQEVLPELVGPQDEVMRAYPKIEPEKISILRSSIYLLVLLGLFFPCFLIMFFKWWFYEPDRNFSSTPVERKKGFKLEGSGHLSQPNRVRYEIDDE